jgi:hypothetical protein
MCDDLAILEGLEDIDGARGLKVALGAGGVSGGSEGAEGEDVLRIVIEVSLRTGAGDQFHAGGLACGVKASLTGCGVEGGIAGEGGDEEDAVAIGGIVEVIQRNDGAAVGRGIADTGGKAENGVAIGPPDAGAGAKGSGEGHAAGRGADGIAECEEGGGEIRGAGYIGGRGALDGNEIGVGA